MSNVHFDSRVCWINDEGKINFNKDMVLKLRGDSSNPKITHCAVYNLIQYVIEAVENDEYNKYDLDFEEVFEGIKENARLFDNEFNAFPYYMNLKDPDLKGQTLSSTKKV